MNRKKAVTLNELLIVIAIIVLMIGLALPAFNALSGSRSLESAQNQVSAYLGQARAQAIGVQEARGVFFFLDTDPAKIDQARAESLYVSTDAEDHPPRDFDDVMAAYDYLKTLPYVDPDRVGIMGWSHGGFITAHLVMAA